MNEFDELKIYYGDDIYITDKIIVTQPTIRQIKDFGERRYFNGVYNLTAVGADLKWQLWESGIDFTKISDYDLFVDYISYLVGSKKHIYKELKENPDKYTEYINNLTEEDLKNMLINPLQLVLKDIDLADFEKCKLKDQIILYNIERDITIDRCIYAQIVDLVRNIHGLKRNGEIPANERTKMDMIEDARDDAMAASLKPYKSMLRQLISTLSVKSGQCGDEKILDMKIGMFLDNFQRMFKIQDSELLLQGAYSGFSSLKGIDKSRLDMSSNL